MIIIVITIIVIIIVITIIVIIIIIATIIIMPLLLDNTMWDRRLARATCPGRSPKRLGSFPSSQHTSNDGLGKSFAPLSKPR